MEKLKQNVILFDLDGTITDSAPGVIQSMRHSLLQCGITPPEVKDMFFMMGPPLIDTYQQVFHLDAATTQKALEIYRKRYEEKGMYENSLFAGVKDMLYTLKEAGKQLGVATSKAQDFAELIIEHFGIRDCFDFIAGCDSSDLQARNTKAKVISFALVSMQASKDNAVLVGDRMYDIMGAKEIGIPVIAVEYGYGERDELVQYGADYIVPTPQDVVNLFL